MGTVRQDKTLGVAQAAQAIGCSESALRRLDRIHVVESYRDPWGRRLFSQADVAAARRHLEAEAARKRAKNAA